MVRGILLISLVALMAFVFLSTLCFAEIDPETAVGIYLFEEDNGNEVIDQSGKEHHGTFVAGGGEWDVGKFGFAVNIAAGGWIRVENAEALHPVDEWTIVAWSNISNISGFHTIVTKWNEYLLRIDTPTEGSKLSSFINLGGQWGSRASSTIPKTETWIHAALVWNNNDNGSLKVYMDGVQAGQSVRLGEVQPNDNPLCIGSQTGSWLWDGLLDEVGIFNVALEDEDIKSIMENGLEEALGGGISVAPQAALTVTWGKLKIW